MSATRDYYPWHMKVQPDVTLCRVEDSELISTLAGNRCLTGMVGKATGRQTGKTLVEMRVVAGVIRKAGPCHVTAGRDVAEDRALGPLVPADIEGA